MWTAKPYERTAYLPQREVELTMSDSINAKLNNLIDNTDDINNYDSAFAALENCRKAYKADRGSGGRLNEWQARLSEVELRIAQYAEKAKEAARLEGELKAEEAQLRELRKREAGLRERSGQLSLLERLREYRQDAVQADRKAAGLESFFRDGVPTEQELADCREAVGKLGSLRAEWRGLRLPEETQAELAQLSARQPSEEEADRLAQAQTSGSVAGKKRPAVLFLRRKRSGSGCRSSLPAACRRRRRSMAVSRHWRRRHAAPARVPCRAAGCR